MISPNKNRYYGHIWWTIWLLVSVVVIMNVDIPRTLVPIWGYGVSVDVILALIVGLIPFIYTQIRNRQHYPSKLLKTMFDPNRTYGKESFGEPLILRFRKSQTVIGFHLFAESKKLVNDIRRIGIRPQVKKSWLIRVLTNYNSQSENIDLYERDNPPIRIVGVKDETHSTQITCEVTDDGACGKWLDYNTAIKMTPNSKMLFWVEIQVNKSWKGYIDFRLNTDDGRRVSHHPCELIRIRQ